MTGGLQPGASPNDDPFMSFSKIPYCGWRRTGAGRSAGASYNLLGWELYATAPMQFLPPHLVLEPCGPAPQGCRKAFLAFRPGYPSACGDTLGREKGRRGLAVQAAATA
jgi:hypothetical protein